MLCHLNHTTNREEVYTMHILSFDVRSQNTLVDTYSTTTMSEGMEWLRDSALTGDLVVISEMYQGCRWSV